jgi:hypothetical protein
VTVSKGSIDKADQEKGQNVQSVTEEVPHPADADSAPGPYEGLSPDRPPVSTSKPDQPIAQSLVAGAGAPHDEVQVTPAEESAEAQAEYEKTVVEVEKSSKAKG